MKLSKAQLTVIEDAKARIDFARSHDFYDWYRNGSSWFANKSNEEIDAWLKKLDETDAVRFIKISGFEINAIWKGTKIGKIKISYKSYSPVIKIYRVNDNMYKSFESLDDAKMHLIQNFRAQTREALDQAEEIRLKLRNRIDALDDQIAELFIKGAEMKSQGKEAE